MSKKRMDEREWWSTSPSRAWLKRSDGEGSKEVWALDKGRDPLKGRDLSWWSEFNESEGPSRCNNTAELLEEHWALNGGAIRTRFPPEPNGYLHIGHAKSMNMNFKLAFDKLEAAMMGSKFRRETVFRYDDTNPEKENAEFVESLARDVEWMGWTPVKTTHTSDYFETLFQMAIELIESGKAYVCDQTPAEIEACRKVAKARLALEALKKEQQNGGEKELPGDLVEEAKFDEPEAHRSPFRNRTVQENLRLFALMKAGACNEGSRTLRLKMEAAGGNLNMFDQVAYRIKFSAHPHVGDTWCIYPTYDYTHCIIDALEHVDYSICTLEFETRRESYYWVLDALDLYRPKVFEMSRLNLTYTVLSKRKLTKLVDTKVVRGWDDPRMPTISGMRRRGFSAKALNAFCDDVGVTRNENHVEYDRLEHAVRSDLEKTAKRRFAVKQPLELLIENASSKTIRAPEFPGGDESKFYECTLTGKVFIDRDDFRTGTPDPSFFGLALNKTVRLRHCVNVRCDAVDYSDDSEKIPIRVRCTVVSDDLDPKGKIHWLSDVDAVECELRDYEHLFKEAKIDDENWEAQINPASEIVYPNALVHRSLLNAPEFDPTQFERLGFYVVDRDSTPSKPVFNRAIRLKSAVAVKAPAKSRKAEQDAQLAKKNALRSIDPKRMFQVLDDYKGLYSAYDADGLPTHAANGDPLTKSTIKKLKKDQAKQKKLFDSSATASS